MAGPDRIRAYVGLGSNLGEAAGTLAAAVAALDGLDGVDVVGVSRLYATEPVGVLDQPEFRNAVVALDLRADVDAPAEAALELLVRLKSLERAFGRTTGPRWGPRPLDLDILLFGRWSLAVERPPAARSIDADEGVRSGGPIPSAPPIRSGREELSPFHLLRVPHPEARVRGFVLAPLADLAPDLVPPGWDVTVAEAARQRERIEGPGAVRVVGAWDALAGDWRTAAA